MGFARIVKRLETDRYSKRRRICYGRSLMRCVLQSISTMTTKSPVRSWHVNSLPARPGYSRGPIVDLSRAVAEGRSKARYLIVPKHESEEEREAFLVALEERADNAEQFITDVTIDLEGSSRDGIVRFDTASGSCG